MNSMDTFALDIGYIVCALGGAAITLGFLWYVADLGWKLFRALHGWTKIYKAVNAYKKSGASHE